MKGELAESREREARQKQLPRGPVGLFKFSDLNFSSKNS